MFITEYFPTIFSENFITLLKFKNSSSPPPFFFWSCEVNFKKEVQLGNSGVLNILVIFTKNYTLQGNFLYIPAKVS